MNGPENKQTNMPCIRHYIPRMTLTDYMIQEKNEEEDLPILKTALTHQYNDLNATYKSVEKDLLQPPEKNKNNHKAKMERKNNSMDVLSD